MNKEKLGKFVAAMRREQNMTQKELAERLFITDKAVSKWERGLSYPDISMLEPMAEILQVTVLELLRGERFEEDVTLTVQDAHEIVEESLTISDEEINRKHTKSKSIILICCVAIMFFISLILNIRNILEQNHGVGVIRMNHPESYTMEETKGGEITFENPSKALQQIIEDCKQAGMDERLVQYLEILENSLEKVVEE